MKFILLRLNQQIDRFVFHAYRTPTQALGLFRVAYALSMLLIYGVARMSWIADGPDFMFSPPKWSPVNFLMDSFPSVYFLEGLRVVVTLLYVALLFGYRTRWTSLGIGLVMILIMNLQFSFGKIGHDRVFIYWLPLIMSFSNWGEAYSLDVRRRGPRARPDADAWPLALLALMFAFAMFTAALPKIFTGWLDLQTHAVRSHQYYHYAFLEKRDLMVAFFGRLEAGWFWELSDWGGVLLEISAPLVILRRRWFQPYLIVCIFFHLLNALMFGITSFYANIFLYLLFLNFQPLVRHVPAARANRWLTWPAFAVVAVAAVGYYFWQSGAPFHALLGYLGVSDPVRKVTVILVALAIALYALLRTWGWVGRRAVAGQN